jgi:ABC-2 type transport system permease protein
MSWFWIIFGMIVKTPESVMTTSFIFLMPLTFASNIFVGLETMPSWLQTVVRHNPVTHLTSASRGLMHGHDVGGDIAWVFAASGVMLVIAVPIALRMYYRER